MPREWDLNRRIILRDLPERASSEEIVKLFEKYGKIKNIFVARNPFGFAFLEYEHRHEAEIAIKRSKSETCCGIYVNAELTIRYPDRTLVIQNLNESAKEEKLRRFFEAYGSIKEVWISRFQNTLGFVEFRRRACALEAAEASNGKRCCGFIISVTLASSAARNANNRSRSHRNESSPNERSRSSSRNDSALPEPAITSNSNQHLNRALRRSGLVNRDTCSFRERSVSSSTNQWLNCSICRKNALETRATCTTCGHIFCETCIESAIRRHSECPECQQKITKRNLIRIKPNY